MAIKWFDDIMKMEGVQGVFLTTSKGEIVAKHGVKLKDFQLEQLSIHLSRIISAFHLKETKITEIEFYWKSQYIICKNANTISLVTICETSKVFSLLRITLNVALAKLMDDKKVLKKVKKSREDKDLPLRRGKFSELEKKLIAKLK